MKAEVRITLHNGQSYYYPATVLTFAGGRIWTSDSSWDPVDVRMVMVFPAVADVPSNTTTQILATDTVDA